MPEPVDLAYALGLEPRLAVEYFRSKGYAITFSWDDMAAVAHARAFTVAKAASMDVLTTIRGELQRALSQGTTLRDFTRTLEPRLKALGWWGKQVMERPDGTAQLVQAGSPHRLRTIYQTNMQSAYMAGRYRELAENVAARPYWQYVAVMDLRTRPAHAALHGRVFRADDPIWQKIWPPNGYNCRCRVRALSQRDLEAKGLSVSESGEDLKSFEDVDPATGEVFERVSYKGPGMERPFAPDRGFVGNQALAAAAPEVSIAAKSAILGPAAAGVLNQVIIEGWGAYTRWIDDVVAAGVARGESRVVGYARPEEHELLEALGGRFATGAIVLEDRLIVGRKARRHAEQGRDISIAEWKQLPLALIDRQAVLWDTQNETLLYISRMAGAEDVLRLVVRPSMLGRQREAQDSVRSVSRVGIKHLRDGLRGGQYRLVSGAL